MFVFSAHTKQLGVRATELSEQTISNSVERRAMARSKDVDGNEAWLDRFMDCMKRVPETSGLRAKAGPEGPKAAKTTQAFREVTDDATDQRRAAAVMIKEARLAKEAKDRGLAAQSAPTGRRVKKPTGSTSER